MNEGHRRMRIAQVCHRFHPHIGGVEEHVMEISVQLAKQGHEVAVFALVDDSKFVGIENMNGISVRRFKAFAFSDAFRVPPKGLAKELISYAPDIVHVHNIHSLVPYFAYRGRGNAKFVFTPHYHGRSLTPVRRAAFRVYKPFLNRAIRSAAKIISVSQTERTMLMNDFGINEKQIVVIPNGINEELVKMSANSRRSSQILSVGRMDLPHKRTDKLVKAFKLIENEYGGNLLLIGSGPDKEKVIQLIQELQLGNRVQVKSNLTKRELFEQYCSSSLFVMASENEAYGIVVAEALAAKLKVVVPNSSGLAHFVSEGYATGITLPVTPEKIASSILSVERGNSPSKEYPAITWGTVAHNIDSIYNELSVENVAGEIR